MLTEVQRQFSNDPELFKSIGQALLLANQTSEAKVALERARQLDPQSATTEASLAGPYLQDGNWQAATEHLERALALDPLNLPAASTLLDLYAKQGKEKEAASLSEKITAAFRQTSYDGTEENFRAGGESVGAPGKKRRKIIRTSMCCEDYRPRRSSLQCNSLRLRWASIVSSATSKGISTKTTRKPSELRGR